MTRWRSLPAVLAFSVAACGTRPFEPEPVPVGRVTCARCGMVVSRAVDSAEWVSPGEETRFYDDIGCLATDARSAPGRQARFVHVEGKWARAETASFARPLGTITPMGYGVLAFASRREAAARDRDGRSFSWDELVDQLRPGGADRRRP